MSVKLLTEQCLELLSLKGGCTGLSEAMLVKMPHCWKSLVTRVGEKRTDARDLISFNQKWNELLIKAYNINTLIIATGHYNFLSNKYLSSIKTGFPQKFKNTIP